MSNLESRIELLGAYFDGILRLPEDHNGVRIIVPNDWVMYEKVSDNYNIIPMSVFDNNISKILFIGDKNATILDIMDFAYEVIMNNIENENKKELFELKVKELASLFDANHLCKLKNLVFKFEKSKKIKHADILKNTKLDNSTDNNAELNEIKTLADQKD
jgi:hypothetical protein